MCVLGGSLWSRHPGNDIYLVVEAGIWVPGAELQGRLLNGLLVGIKACACCV